MDEPWSWPASLDALTAAAETHRELFENDSLRVLETRISLAPRSGAARSVRTRSRTSAPRTST